MGKQTDMNNYLLDTHAFLWAVNRGDLGRLSKDARTVIEDPNVHVYVSAVTAYEITNKHRLGKLTSEHDYTARHIREAIDTLGVAELPIDTAHAEAAGTLDWAHRDPFDRMLAAQAVTDGLILITSDETLRTCPFVETLW